MIQAPLNNALVEIEKKFQDKDGGIYVDPTWHPEDFATLEGVVVSAPVRTQSDNGRTVKGTIKNGDKVFFSYGVIFEYESQPDEDTPVYKNLVLYEGKEYWKVNVGEIFCTVTDEGIKMVTDNVLIEPWQEEAITDNFFIPQVIKNETGIIKAIPDNTNLSCVVGDKIAFESKFVQQYNIFGKIHYTRYYRIMGRLNCWYSARVFFM